MMHNDTNDTYICSRVPLAFGSCILIVARARHPDLSEVAFKTRAKGTDDERHDVTEISP